MDVLIIGAGISGIGAGCHLTMKCPDRSFTILEGREAIGGTWDLFRYPGIRSDSDMHTFGYAFRPWVEKRDIATGESIRNYLRETIREYGLEKKIRFSHRVSRVAWFPESGKWIADVENQQAGRTFQISCSYLLSCTGYYNYAEGHLPHFKDYEQFKGTIAHPQHWPEDLDYKNRRVLVIGSGATAVTLVPAMAADAAHVTMLQRSPGYVFSRPAEDAIAIKLRRWLPGKLAYRLTRAKNVLLAIYLYTMSRRKPDKVRTFLRNMVKEGVGPDVDVDVHFNPEYRPWDQRLCVVPDGDLFRALREGSASIVTDHIERFTEKGVKLVSGAEIEADIIVPATGLALQFMGGIEMVVAGNKIESGDLVCYKGMMYSNIPNFTAVMGYTNASWTLKADLTCDYVCRLLNYMKKRGYRTVAPLWREEAEAHEPLIGLKAGYVMRALEVMPKQGNKFPWRTRNDYIRDLFAIRFSKIDDGVLAFGK